MLQKKGLLTGVVCALAFDALVYLSLGCIVATEGEGFPSPFEIVTAWPLNIWMLIWAVMVFIFGVYCYSQYAALKVFLAKTYPSLNPAMVAKEARRSS
ncbi:MAG: hypothetical protein LIO90_08175 [Bacteroidales bacterium]|nr:hypothetical protein [Bacteroidales bacterium]